ILAREHFYLAPARVAVDIEAGVALAEAMHATVGLVAHVAMQAQRLNQAFLAVFTAAAVEQVNERIADVLEADDGAAEDITLAHQPQKMELFEAEMAGEGAGLTVERVGVGKVAVIDRGDRL